ncbi:hypothetical protein B0H21DRAFT_691362 [Amylocystis lapponica]|nr:hypothetical protein B0H21DRAFT_691362 [Amylocystis lapponica]
MRSASSCVSDRSLQYHPSPTASLDSRLRRGYSTAQSAPSSTSFPDPDRPDLFYHLFEPPTPLSSSVPVFALSFIAQRPSSANSSAVIGWLPASAPGDADDAGLNDFVENETFRHVLHEAIRSALRDNADDIQMNAALQTQQGWMHIHGMIAMPYGRNVPALGRIGDPDDIIASVRVEEGKILSDTYQPMPSYRLCTADGVLQLTDGLAQRLREVLAARGAEAR